MCIFFVSAKIIIVMIIIKEIEAKIKVRTFTNQKKIINFLHNNINRQVWLKFLSLL
jgi:hypothetical protein